VWGVVELDAREGKQRTELPCDTVSAVTIVRQKGLEIGWTLVVDRQARAELVLFMVKFA
jgi:hypothetical protein